MSPLTSLFSILLAAVTLQINLPVDSHPVEFISRAEVVMSLVLARTPDIPQIKNTGQFPDVHKGDWHEIYMLAAEQFGIIHADPKTGLLRPDVSLTRAEFLSMLTQTYGLQMHTAYEYTDVPRDSWYAPYVGVAHRYMLFSLPNPRLLEPGRILTRAEAMKAFLIFEDLKKEDPNLETEKKIAEDQVKKHLRLYSVISTRRTRVTFIDPTNEKKDARKVVDPVALPPSLPELRTMILMYVNEIRIKEGLHALTYNNQLEQSAQAYAEKMAKEGFFSHVSPEGQTLRERIEVTGYYDRTYSPDCFCMKGYSLGENLARGQKSAKEAVDAWMKSPSHRDAILNPDYTDIGVGVKSGLWVQHFGGILLPGQPVHGAAK